MSYCVKPGCENPQNQDEAKLCACCGSKLLLRERYRAIKILGRGGFGKTFLALDEDIPSKPRCVIKQLYFRSDDDEYLNKATRLFRQEAVHLDELGKHPQIPYLLAQFEQELQLYLVQEFIDGKTLEKDLEQGVYNESQIWKLLENLLPVLQFIHERKVIHRDIKPENIIRRSHPNQEEIRKGSLVLIDFGVAKLFTESSLGHTGTVVGSQKYVSPEQAKGKAFPASDLYSLGVTCIRLLTGVSPLDMYDFNNDFWHWHHYLPEGTTVDSDLGNILDKLLQSKISDRFQSADEVLQAIKSATAKQMPAQKIETTIDEVLQSIKSTTFNEAKTEFLPLINQIQSPTHTSSSARTILISQVGVDYNNLQLLLETQKWKEADRETWNLMCQALGKLPSTYLEVNDIDRFPCEDLQIIDQLWVKYSQNRFGFSVQKQLYESVRRDYVTFCNRVNWPTYNSDNYYQGLKFNRNAPVGHLPSRIWVAGVGWLRHAGAIASRLDKCGV